MDRLKIDKIRTDGGTQARALIRADIVAEYAAALADPECDLTEGGTPVVFCDGADYWLADGFQRREAYLKAGRTEMPVKIKNGTLRQARLYAAGANDAHGVRRTPEDKRKAVEMLLADPEWAKATDNWIAAACKVDHKTVKAVRKSIRDFPNTPEASGQTSHGRTYPRKRKGTKPPEPGDETKEKDKPKSGVEVFQTKVFHEHIGKAMKELDKLPHQYGLLNSRGQSASPEHLGLIRRLKEVSEAAGAWQEKLKKLKKKKGA